MPMPSLTDQLAFGLERAGTVTATTVQCATFAAARLLAEPSHGTVIAIPGRDTVGDGYEGLFAWDSASTTADDNSTYIKITAVTTGRWRKLAISAALVTPPVDAGYVVDAAHATLTGERVATTSTTITVNTASSGLMKWDVLSVPLATLANSGGSTGDTAYWNGTAWTRLAASTSGYVLTANGAGVAPSWQAVTSTLAYASLYCDADTTDFTATGAFIDVTGWGGQNCTASGCTVSTANGTIVVTNAGTYRVTFTGVVEIGDGDADMVDVSVQVVKDAVLVPGARRVTNDVPSNGITGSSVAFAINEIVSATAGQTFKAQVYCGTQGGAATSVKIPYANFTVERVA